MNDMIDILEYLHQYVPNARSPEEIQAVDQRYDSFYIDKLDTCIRENMQTI